MGPIGPPRFKPGMDPARVRAHLGPGAAAAPPQRVIEGQALILWDPERPGKKRDAVDTDQITPAEYCVSESLETLDARWKEGAFRHLMPDFGERVRRGQTFVIAGDRFGIGSSREMSPAGLKALAEEAGRELVIVCGRQMGDIFRRNAINLGLHVVECPAAVADAREGDRFRFETGTRRLENVTQGKRYDPAPLSDKELEILKAGGIFAIGRREFLDSLEKTPRIEFPDPERARRMTTTEQIVWAHRVDREGEVRPGATLRVWADLLPASDGTGPFAIYTFDRITGGDTVDPRGAAFASDHFVFTGREADARQTAISRAFAERHGIRPPYYATPGEGIFHFYFPEQGLIHPGGFYPGADSHSRAYGAYGAVGIGVGSTTLGFGWATGYIFFTLAPQRRVVFRGRLQPWVNGKDIVLELLRRWGAEQARGMGVEFVDADRQLPIAYRNTICNMMAEAEAQNGIFAQDEITAAWFEARGFALPYPPVGPGEDARYELDETLRLDEVTPMVAKPFRPGNAYPAEELARERIRFEKALIGSCTNGSYDDLLGAALVLEAARQAGHRHVAAGVQFLVYPGSGTVKRQIEMPDPRLGGRSVAEVIRSVGGEIRASWCGPCFGQGPDALRPGERAITSFNRNWHNRMGVGGLGYLASPQVVAASALLGYIAPPSELGLQWDPERFEVGAGRASALPREGGSRS